MRKDILKKWLASEKNKAIVSKDMMFMGIPDKWYEPYTCCCENGHVSTSYLKSELLGDVCFACKKPVYICPLITEEELHKILYKRIYTIKDILN